MLCFATIAFLLHLRDNAPRSFASSPISSSHTCRFSLYSTLFTQPSVPLIAAFFKSTQAKNTVCLCSWALPLVHCSTSPIDLAI
ncbi:hypothetical protein PITC_053460 [Penicillium italicum]|uniref:Uncharacterized protein n=1 Tax=Penicillium italicum TaxID=40296 RepID=A0A0A2KMC7_PENIT|nr:hypothetical protein PITC_053460 [Penicillium italicum]